MAKLGTAPESEIERCHAATRSWIWVDADWPSLSSDCRSLALVSKKITSLAPLLDLKQLEGLHLCPVRPEGLETLNKLKNLKVLLLYDIRTESLEALTGLKNLEVLRIMHAAKLTTLSGLEHFKKLRALDIYHMPRVASLEPLAGLSSLRELSIQMSFGTDKLLRFNSLEPLRHLSKLEILKLLGVSPHDSSLRPLAGLKNLQYLGLGLFLPVEEYAYLAAHLPSSISDCLRPVITFGDEDERFVCKKCKGHQVGLVGRTSKRHRFLVCPECDKKLVEEHVRIFEQHLQAAPATK